ncbi:hypothetical protein [Methylomagnum ishizawai]|uniref:hypothetical protein n=1 Tax=Methylomagnum ishizawai TaxID=1760988 RepID=UPI001C33DC81|nr:hypothetical protein [Methylomagnum ishizawai]BBL76722.1 hypothetical protein MishRS11D_38200 [Methylomagnum ishizawai]
MNTLDLIAAAALPPGQQAEILRYVLALAGEPSPVEAQGPERTQTILRRAWGAWGRADRDEIDRTLAALRDEWERDFSGSDLCP